MLAIVFRAEFPLLVALLLVAPFTRADADDGKLVIQQLASGVYLHTSYKDTPNWGRVSSNGIVVVKEGEAYIVDTPWPKQDTRELLQWIDASGFALAGALTTHAHDDRAAGIGALNEMGVPTHASSLTNELLLEQDRPRATSEYDSGTFSLAGGAIEAWYPGPGHAADNLVVWLPDSGILYGGCLVRPKTSNSLGNTTDSHPELWPQSVQNVLDRYPYAQWVVPGHGAPAKGIQLLPHTKALADEFLAGNP